MSYLEYQETLSQNDIVGRTINVLNPPGNPQNNQLTLLGYDQNGHPIYSGNTQYFANQPPIVPNNNANANTTTNINTPNVIIKDVYV